MNIDNSIFIYLLGILALGFYFKIYIKSTIEQSVSHQFNIKLENLKQEFTREMNVLDRKDKFRLAAIDKRLEAHQLAFGLAIEMFQRINAKSEERNDLVKKLDNFWKNYALFLNNKSRKSFKSGFDNYSVHGIVLNAWQATRDEKYAKQLEEKFELFRTLPNLIAQEIDLESMGIEAISMTDKRVTPYGLEDNNDKHLSN